MSLLTTLRRRYRAVERSAGGDCTADGFHYNLSNGRCQLPMHVICDVVPKRSLDWTMILNPTTTCMVFAFGRENCPAAVSVSETHLGSFRQGHS